MQVLYREKEWELHGEWRVQDAIKEVGLTPHMVVAVRDGRVLSDDALLSEDDQVRFVPVISGG